MLKVALVARRLKIRLLQGGATQPSNLDLYHVTCLIEQTGDKSWKVTAQLRGDTEKNFLDPPINFRPRNVSTSHPDNLDQAKAGALKYVKASVLGAAAKLGITKNSKIEIGNISWDEGHGFRFR